MKLRAQVTRGRLVYDDQPALAAVCHKLEGKRVTVTVEPVRTRRSVSQNAYYWSVVLPLVAAVLTESLREKDPQAPSVTAEEAHEACKRQFLGAEVLAGLPVVRSTTMLDTGAFSAYVDQIRNHCALAGWYCPAPNEHEEETA